jgi:hypothetical protein
MFVLAPEVKEPLELIAPEVLPASKTETFEGLWAITCPEPNVARSNVMSIAGTPIFI